MAEDPGIRMADDRFNLTAMSDDPYELDALQTARWIEGDEKLDRMYRDLLAHVRSLRAIGGDDDAIVEYVTAAYEEAKMGRTVGEARVVRAMLWQALNQLREEG